MQLSQSLKFTDIPKDAIIYAKLPKVKAADTLTRNINGIGTTLYGKREFQKDGSYISTVWLIFLLFPLIPLRSFRIRKSGTDSMYEIIEKVPMNWRQVLYIYGYVAFFFVWTSISIHKEAIFWLGTGALVCAPFFVRRWARSNAK
jgi:hypothetical protein